VDVAPLLAKEGYRVVVPYLRGYGTTRFLSSATPRNGQPSALAADAVALMDALKMQSALIGGCDWGARTGDIVAALWPERVTAFDNPDHVAIAIHNYRWRLGLAEGESKFDPLEKQLAQFPAISVPAITLEGDANGAPHADPGAYAKKFSGRYTHRTLTGGIGH